LVIFDCNGVLVDSEPIAFAVLVDAFKRVGMILSAETMMRRFHGRRPADIFAAVEAATGKSLPRDFSATVAAETLRRLRAELHPIAHTVHALTWIRGCNLSVQPGSGPPRAGKGRVRNRRTHHRSGHAGAQERDHRTARLVRSGFPDATKQVSPGSARTQLSPSARSGWASVSA
jgi:beta-phosphoglucomutase-like phosphatase (HAD superfamily)